MSDPIRLRVSQICDEKDELILAPADIFVDAPSYDALAAELAKSQRLHAEAFRLAIFHQDRATTCEERNRGLAAELATTRRVLLDDIAFWKDCHGLTANALAEARVSIAQLEEALRNIAEPVMYTRGMCRSIAKAALSGATK